MTEPRSKRPPQVFDADDPAVHVRPEVSPNDDDRLRHNAPNEDGHTQTTVPPSEPSAGPAVGPRNPVAGSIRSGIRWGSMLVSAAVALALLAVGLWFSRFVSVAVARDDWLGWIAKGLAIVIGIAVVALILREIIGFLSLARLGRIRRLADRAVTEEDIALERGAVESLKHLAGSRAETKWALSRFRESERHQTQQGALLRLADTVLMAPSDKAARRVVYESSRRVAVITAVVPIAVFTVLFVLFENIRMVRRLAAAYGGRPGFLGGVRLLWRVIAYVAASGAIVLTDDLFGQFLGQDIVRRLSRRLGEGAFNGALTARLGVAAIELCRPLPYIATSPLRTRHVVSELFPEFSPGQLVGRAFGRERDDAERVFPKRRPSHDQ